jgi:hypothetical protein
MRNSQKVREFVTAHPDSARATIAAGTGISGETVGKIVYGRVKCGEFLEEPSGEVRMNPDFVRFKQTNRLPKKLRGFRAENRARKGKGLISLADVARKHVSGAPSASVASVSLQSLALSTFAVLEQVLDLDGADPMLVAAFKAHGDALRLANTASAVL